MSDGGWAEGREDTACGRVRGLRGEGCSLWAGYVGSVGGLMGGKAGGIGLAGGVGVGAMGGGRPVFIQGRRGRGGSHSVSF